MVDFSLKKKKNIVDFSLKKEKDIVDLSLKKRKGHRRFWFEKKVT